MAQQPKRQPMGKPLPSDDKTLDGLSQVSPADVQEAEVWVKRNADRKGQALWGAGETQ